MSSLLSELKHQSTWRLAGLTVLTYGVYAAHYIKRQTRILNASLPQNERISDDFITLILAISYASLFLFIGYLALGEEHPVALISNVIDQIGNVLFLIWAFKARARMNRTLGSKKGSETWFHGLWTFLFTSLYFNYRVNQIAEWIAEDTRTG